MSPMPRQLVLAALLAPSACSGAAGNQKPIEEAPAQKTEAVLVGPLCKGDQCACRQGDDDAGRPEGAAKRFEVRVGPSDDHLWVTVDGMVLYKAREVTDACWYVDLEPGPHKVTMRGKGDGGLQAAMALAEQGGGDGRLWWYRTFDFNCGAPGECDLETIKAWKAQVAKLAGKHDPCGSTKVEGIEWETGRMPDRAHPEDLLLRLTLNVYKFTPKSPPGSSDCDKSGEGGAGGEGAAPPGGGS